MAVLDTLSVTDLGLLNISKKVINSRVFSNSLITAVGTPIINNGIASGFSKESYLSFTPIELSAPEKISVSFKGTFTKGNNPQQAFKLMDSTGNSISLIFKNESVELLCNKNRIFSFHTFIENGEEASVFLTLKANSYEFVMNYGDQVIQKVDGTPFNLPISSLSILNIGNSSSDSENYWLGTIDLKEFFIYADNTVCYAPSIGETWSFSNILVSDGALPLNNSTAPTAGHIYSFDVKEISRSGSTVLLTCQMDDDSYITIKEIGLYINTNQGKILFGVLSGLNINKTKDVPYDLILTVNTSVSVVNAVGFPAENEIIVRDPDFVELKDFTTVQQVNLYVLTNLERIIRMNAGAKGSYENSSIINNQAGIGHNRPQIIYRLQQEIEQDENCYNAIDTFVKLINKFEYIVRRELNFDTLKLVGNIKASPTGEVHGFSHDSYLEKPLYFNNTSDWSISAEVLVKNNSHGTLLSLENREGKAPLEIGLNSNKQCYLKILGEESINPSLLNSYYVKSSNNNISQDNSTYFAWERVSSEPCYNFHCYPLSVSTSPLVSFPQAELVTLQHNDMSSNFTLSIRIKFDHVDGIQYIIKRPEEISKASFELLLTGGILKAYLYDGQDQSLITENLQSRYQLKANTYYKIRLSYNGEKYTLSYESEPVGEEYIDKETINIYSYRTISLGEDNNLIVGGNPAENDYFNGIIDFANFSIRSGITSWQGLSTLNYVYTLENTPEPVDTIYDRDFSIVEGSNPLDYTQEVIINQNNIFQLVTNNNYLITISYNEDDVTQKGTYSMIVTHNGTSSEVLSKEVDIQENRSNRMMIPYEELIGINSSSALSPNPYSSSLNLLNWNVRQGENEYPFSEEMIINNSTLTQFYDIPESNKNQYAIHDLCDTDCKIRFLSNKFEGNKDLIDFSYEEGLTLCVKVDLKNVEPKVILYKSNLSNNVYFSLTLINQNLLFTLFTADGTIELSKQLDITEYSDYADYPILITIIAEHNEAYSHLKMYRNNLLVDEKENVIIDIPFDPSIFVLSNYKENMPTYEVEGEGETVIKTIEPAKYVEDIIVIKGAISEEELFYINNLMNTNF